MSEKLQKVLARSGYGSRREIEAMIAAGRIRVDDRVAQLGERIDAEARVRIDGHDVVVKPEQAVICRVLMYHKPEGELCTRKDPEGRPTVYQRLPRMNGARWVAVGRLDVNTSGLLLFTTDGELANRLMHPSQQVEREYAVRVFGEVNDAMLQRLRRGVQLEDGVAHFTQLKHAGGEGMNQWFHVTLTEGRNREVRRLWESQGVQVSRLIRIRYGNMPLESGLPQGGWSEMPLTEVNYLRELVGLPAETRSFLDARQSEPKQRKLARIRRANAKHRERQRHTGAKSERQSDAKSERKPERKPEHKPERKPEQSSARKPQRNERTRSETKNGTKPDRAGRARKPTKKSRQ